MKAKLCVSLDTDLVSRLDNVRNRIPRSTMLNEALERGLEHMESKIA
ncbi:hypothetical protein [uncultured Methanolobus sp.]|nr:hypothetical protein [uncultured Methanolobus sp.]